jgi:hypothetical protein
MSIHLKQFLIEIYYDLRIEVNLILDDIMQKCRIDKEDIL